MQGVHQPLLWSVKLWRQVDGADGVWAFFAFVHIHVGERNKLCARKHSIRQTRVPSGHFAVNAQDLLHMLSTQGGNS